MSRVSQVAELRRVGYSVLVLALVCVAAYMFVLPTGQVEAQKFQKKEVTRTETLATTTFPTTTTLPATIPDNVPAGTTLSIPVSGLTDEVRGVALNITADQPAGGGGHTWIGDLTMRLFAPGGTPSHLIMQRVGSTSGTGSGDSTDFQGPYTFTDGSTGDIWTEAAILVGGTVPAGTYRTIACCSPSTAGPGIFTNMNPVFQGPALMEPNAVFKKSNETKTVPIEIPANVGNGLWQVNISDSAGGDTGRVSQLSLTITTLAPTATVADIYGRVLSAGGLPISRATVSILNTDTGQLYTTTSNHFGNFVFEDLDVEDFYSMWVEHGRYTFDQPVQNFVLNDDILDARFISSR